MTVTSSGDVGRYYQWCDLGRQNTAERNELRAQSSNGNYAYAIGSTISMLTSGYDYQVSWVTVMFPADLAGAVTKCCSRCVKMGLAIINIERSPVAVWSLGYYIDLSIGAQVLPRRKSQTKSLAVDA